MENSAVELSKMVRSFRVSDLQSLLNYAGRNKYGKKDELQIRALDLLKIRSPQIELKIRELHNNRYSRSRTQAEASDEWYGTMSSVAAPMNRNFSGPQQLGPPVMAPGASVIPNREKNFSGHSSQMNYFSHYPVNPEVRLKELPFYDILDELIRPTSLVNHPNDRFKERNLVFYFTPRQVMDLQTHMDTQVQLRICNLDTSCDQDDEIPVSISLNVNRRTCNLPNPLPTNKPGAEPKRPKRPVDITNFINSTTTECNEIAVSWTSSMGKPYVVAVYLVRKLNSTILINRLKANGVRNPDHTTAMIKEKLCQDRDSEIATMSLRGSLVCPLGKIKMKLPCRALTCSHLQCFEAALYLQMNEKKPKWICPVCDKPAYFKNLAIDGLFLDITCKAPSECTEVQFHEDGSWTPVMPVKKQTEVNDASYEAPPPPKDVPKVQVSKQPKKSIEIIDLDLDSDTEDSYLTVLPDNNYESTNNTHMEPLEKTPDLSDTYCSGSPKNKIPKLAPNRSPLSESIDSVSSDDCILGAPPIFSGPGSSGFNSMPVTYDPDVSSQETSAINPLQGTANPLYPLPERINLSPSNNRPYRDFDLFSLIQEKSDDVSNNYPRDMSPDIIDLD